MFDIQENVKKLPDKPGVYLHKDLYGEIIYVGKAASLRSRVRQYFQSPKNMDAKVRAMVSHISEFEYIITNTEMEALILEDSLIKKHMPRYNVLLRDDKTYPYIKLTMAEPYPRIVKTRRVTNDGSRYFGPYADVRSVNQMIDLLNDIYRLKRCTAARFPAGFRPCLNKDIDRCRGVCQGDVDPAAYGDAVGGVAAFLDGKSAAVTAYLKRKMEAAAADMDYEAAAVFRDQLQAARSVMEKQRVVLLSGGDMDIVLAAQGEEDAHVVVFFVREGRLTGKESHHLQAMREDRLADIVSAFLKQYYINQSHTPKEVLVAEPLPDGPLIEAWMTALRGGAVRVHVPLKGDKRALLDLARKDLADTAGLLDERARTQREKDVAVSNAFREFLGLADEGAPRVWRVEAYDISHTGGVDSVGAMVVFTGTKPARQEYRRFKIKTAEGADDYSSMQEVLYRRLKRWQNGDAGFSPLPDVILLDGGAGHVNAVLQVLRAMRLDVPVAGMVKDDRHRSRGLVFGGGEMDLKKNPLLYHFTGTIQEEVHRFAIDYHKGMRGKRMVRSELERIGGIGPKRRNALLAHFGSMERIRAAGAAELSQAPGMTQAAAEAVRRYFNETADPQA
jgi:excinuclease ABC subunit C